MQRKVKKNFKKKQKPGAGPNQDQNRLDSLNLKNSYKKKTISKAYSKMLKKNQIKSKIINNELTLTKNMTGFKKMNSKTNRDYYVGGGKKKRKSRSKRKSSLSVEALIKKNKKSLVENMKKNLKLKESRKMNSVKKSKISDKKNLKKTSSLSRNQKMKILKYFNKKYINLKLSDINFTELKESKKHSKTSKIRDKIERLKIQKKNYTSKKKYSIDY